MNRSSSTEERITAFLSDGPTSGPDDLLTSAHARARSSRQRPTWRIRLQGDPMETTWRARPLDAGRLAFIVLTSLLVVALAATALVVGSRLRGTPDDQRNAVPVIPTGGEALLAFASFDKAKSTSDIYVVRGDGTGGKRITTGPGYRFSPAWSPDGSRLAYYSKQGGTTDLRVSSATGVPVLLASDMGCFPSTTAPAWSPDGRFLLYIVDRDPNDGSCDDLKSDVYIVPADGSAPGRRLLAASVEGWSSMPDWSGDRIVLRINDTETTSGLWVAGVANPAAPWDLEPVRIDQGNPSAAWGFGWTRWSPDGSTLATTHLSEGTDFGNAVTLSPDGSGTRSLWSDPTVDTVWPDWSPDGTRLSLLVLTGLTDQYGIYELITAAPDGSDPTVIETPELNGNGGPAMISPDGTLAAARTQLEGDATPGHVLIVSLDGSAVPVEIPARQWTSVSWQPVANPDNPAANAPDGLPNL